VNSNRDKLMDEWESEGNSWTDIKLKKYTIRYYNLLDKFGRKNLLKIAEAAMKLAPWTGPGDQKVEISSFKDLTYLAWNIIIPETKKRWVVIDEKSHFERGISCDLSKLRTPMSDGQHRHGEGIELDLEKGFR